MTLVTKGIEFVPWEEAVRHPLSSVTMVWSSVAQLFGNRPHGILIVCDGATVELMLYGASRTVGALSYFRAVNELGTASERPFLILDSFKEPHAPAIVVLFQEYYKRSVNDGSKHG